MIKSPTYNWCCPKCDATNSAGASVCAACQHDVTYRAPSLWDNMQRDELPRWKRIAVYVVLIVGLPTFVIGLALLLRVYFLTSLEGMAWGAAAALLGAGLTGVAVKLYPRCG